MTPEPQIIHADARVLPLPDDSVDLIVTSPPYYGLRSYQDGGTHYADQIGGEAHPDDFLDALLQVTAECKRVLKPTGSMFVNLGDSYGRYKSLELLPERYRIRAVDQLGLIARAVLIWSKTNGRPESVTDRVRRSHEDWVHLTRSAAYYADLDEVRQPYEGDRALSRRVKKPGVGKYQQRAVWEQPHEKGSLPGSVWPIAGQPFKAPEELGVDHYAPFPMEWPRRLISGWCPPGGVVLDPFGGTGTTALVATVLGRHAVSVDASADYCRLAEWRVNDPGQRERAARLSTPRTDSA